MSYAFSDIFISIFAFFQPFSPLPMMRIRYAAPAAAAAELLITPPSLRQIFGFRRADDAAMPLHADYAATFIDTLSRFGTPALLLILLRRCRR
jgi:hypothetical protein